MACFLRRLRKLAPRKARRRIFFLNTCCHVYAFYAASVHPLNFSCFFSSFVDCRDSLKLVLIAGQTGGRTRDSSSESSSSSSSSEEPTGRPKQLPVEEDRTPSEPVDLGASTSESEEGKDKVYKEALRAPFLAWRVAELQKVAPGVDLPEDLSKELTQKKWEQAARTVLQEVEPEPDFNVKFLTEQKWRLTARARGPDHRHVYKCNHSSKRQLKHNSVILFSSIGYVLSVRQRTWWRRPRKRHGWHMMSFGHWLVKYYNLARYIHTYIPTYVHTYIRTYLHTYIPTYVHTYIRTYVHTYIRTYGHTYIRTYVHTYTYIRTYVHTYVCTYIRTYIRTYVHKYIRT